MRIDEAFRRVVGGYWWLVVLLVLGAASGAYYYGLHQPKQYEAVARIQMSGGLASTNVQADAATQWFQGVITSPNLLKKAMVAAGIAGDPTAFATDSVSVTRVGVSTVNDLSVVTTNPDRAVIVANSLVQQALSYANTSHQSDAAQMEALSKQIAALTAQRDQLIAQLPSAPPGQVLELQARVAAAAPTLTDLLRQRSDVVLAASQRSSIGLLGPASLLPNPVGPKIPQLIALAGLAGLLLGMGLAAIAEAVRPRVRGRRWVAAELGVPRLGHVPTSHLDSPRAARALREFATGATLLTRRFRGQTVVLLPVDKRYAGWAARVADEVGSLTGLHLEHRLEGVHPVPVGRRGEVNTLEAGTGDVGVVDGGVVVIALARPVEVQRNLEEFVHWAGAMGCPVAGVLTFHRPWLLGRWARGLRGQRSSPGVDSAHAAHSRAAHVTRVGSPVNQGPSLNDRTRRVP